jgi:hypothetical protein
MTPPSQRSRNAEPPIPSVEPLTTAIFLVPRLSVPDELVRVEVEDAGYDDVASCYVTRFRFLNQSFRNEFSPVNVPFGALREARDIANAALLVHLDLDLEKAVREQ